MELLYKPSEIRTSNQVPDRSSDIVFYEDESLTQQQFLAETDINNIVRRDLMGSPTNHINQATPQWGDFGDSVDFQSHQNYIIEANNAFNALPAIVRERFHNNPAELLDFMQHDENQEEAIRLGLATRREAPPEPLSDDEPDLIPNPKKKTPQTAPKPLVE